MNLFFVWIFAIAFTFGQLNLAESKGLLKNFRFNGCLQTLRNGANAGSQLELTGCDVKDSGQWLNVDTWKYNDATSRLITFEASKLNIGTIGSGVANGELVVQTDASTQWQIIPGAYLGTFQLKHVASSRCLTAEKAGGVYMDLWDCSGSITEAKHQFWYILYVPDPADPDKYAFKQHAC